MWFHIFLITFKICKGKGNIGHEKAKGVEKFQDKIRYAKKLKTKFLATKMLQKWENEGWKNECLC